MRKISIFIASTFFLLTIVLTAAADTSTGTPEAYRVTINRVEMYNDTTSTWVTLGQGDMTFDIASADAGAAVGSYVSGASLPVGLYTQVRVRVSRTMQIQGNVGSSYTSTTASSADVGSSGQGIQAGSAPAQLGTIIVPTDGLPAGMTVDGDYFSVVYSLGADQFTITKGASKKVTVKFNVTGTLVLDDTPNPDVFYCEGPTVTYSLQ